MTSNASGARGALPGLDELAAVCDQLGLRHTRVTRQRSTSNAVYLLNDEHLVVRLAPDTPVRRRRAETAVALTRWIAEQSDAITVAPTRIPQPVLTADVVATVWPHHPAPPAAPPDLAMPLRGLHALPDPPFEIPEFQPLTRLYEALAIDHERPHPILTDLDHEWLTARADELVEDYHRTEFPLGRGIVHGDAHTGNLVRDGDRWVLIDWDNACRAPKEADLVAGLPDHFHVPSKERAAFLAAYGYDLTTHDEWRLVRDLAELKSLASYIRRSPAHPDIAAQLRTRLRSLQSGDRTVTWRPVP